jgi:hypothetical protein
MFNNLLRCPDALVKGLFKNGDPAQIRMGKKDLIVDSRLCMFAVVALNVIY